MSALLAFAWRRCRNQRIEEDRQEGEEHNDHLYNHHRTFNPRHSPVQPSLLESHSSDASTVVTDYKRDEFICILRPRVVTPDGLKPRRSMVDLRDELLPGYIAETFVPDTSTNKESPTDEDKIQESSSTAIVPVEAQGTALLAAVQDTEQAQHSDMWKVMPEAFPRSQMPWNHQQGVSGAAFLPPLPTRSWSTEGAWSSPTPAYSSQNGSSPPSTRRGSWGTTPSAESPNLVPGQARTAVGNLVALQQDPPGTTPIKDTSYDWAYSPQEQGVETMYSPMFSRASSRNNARRTYPLPKIAEQGVIVGMSHVKSTQARSNEQQGEGIEPMFSPLHSSKKSSVKANFSAGVSTLPAPLPVVRSSVLQPATAVTNSAVATTVVPDHQGTTEVILSHHSHAGYSWTVSSSGGSSGSKATKRSITSLTNSVVFKDDNVLVHVVDDDLQRTKARALDGELQRAKARSQQRTKEELILAALERLQDDLPLVSDVEDLLGVGSSQGMSDWFVPTPLDEEGILTGISEAKRYFIMDKLDLLLDKLSSDVSFEDFVICSSMVDVSEYQIDAQEELREALNFCKVLVQMAVPEYEKEDSSLQGTDVLGNWHFLPGLREAIGLLPTTAETPPVARGGDSSVFSLPADDDCETPMTSNRSLGASTLTTIVNNGMSPTTPRNVRTKLKQQNGLHLRQAIQLLSSGLQKMSKICLALSKMDAGCSLSRSGMVRVADQIKQAYIQMLAMSQLDLKSVVDAFEFELDTEHSYVYEDSDEEEDVTSPIFHASTLGVGTLANISDDREDSSFDTGPISPPRTGDLSFTDVDAAGDVDDSPKGAIFEYDDLRRHMGSADREDAQVEEREAAPNDEDGLSRRTYASSRKSRQYEPFERLEL